MKGVIIAVLVVLAIVQVMVRPIEAFDCGDIGLKVIWCAPYLTGYEVQPSFECCNGVKIIKTMLATRDDKIQICNCLKWAVTNYRSPEIKDAPLAALPVKCGTTLPYTISKNMDCDK
ncbi:Non-specific lipid-transfer protein cw18 [Thalictrum thalictroides]|uniref:Non-specific lipid-transfer protein cw18 n=1 Tax=Thalictrum thalictroides TaxID=46969 RepID=A0A7J6WK55_THATH|nr:Non-specific lipid-transfer protein cw18 [Thalictrum thalictroides]